MANCDADSVVALHCSSFWGITTSLVGFFYRCSLVNTVLKMRVRSVPENHKRTVALQQDLKRRRRYIMDELQEY